MDWIVPFLLLYRQSLTSLGVKLMRLGSQNIGMGDMRVFAGWAWSKKAAYRSRVWYKDITCQVLFGVYLLWCVLFRVRVL